jgi:hypothetical protein
MSPRIGFVFGMVFPTDDLLSEWVATLALAFNDLALVQDRIVADAETPHRFFYWLRLAIAHFYEAAKYLDDTAEVDEVKAFVATLPAEAQQHYETCLERYREQQTPVERLRNQAAFHYPRLQPNRQNRPMKKVLASLADEAGQIDKGEQNRLRDSRLLFADDIMSRFFVEASGGEDALGQVHPNIEAAITAFMRFTQAALDEWFYRAQQDRGAKLFDFGEGSLPWPGKDVESRGGEMRRTEESQGEADAASSSETESGGD